MLKKILIANRGEIAARIIRTCKRMGVKTVAVYSEADSRSPYVGEADEAILLGPSRPSDSYLNAEKIVAAAVSSGCDAVHPGYGFLSENAEFAQMVERAGITFIGPSADVIATLGDKIAAKKLAQGLGVPVVPGIAEPLTGSEEAREVAERIGFPVLLKPASGGGGRGIRVVRDREELASAFKSSRDETRKGFSGEGIFLERFIASPRHIEAQIAADAHGGVIHLGERECSIQRRYQKIVEEAPSTALDDATRTEMGRIGCLISREAGYRNLGTVEFILDTDGKFYFLEMNTRLQVEHPVTEMTTGLDLVEWQIRIAAGEPLPLRQEDVKIRGWAIEARVCAEDPARGFVPTTGIVSRYSEPRGTGIRVDSGLHAGSEVTVHYDSILAKVIAGGASREEARRTLVRALNGFHLEGLETNVDFVNAIVNHPDFIDGNLSTGFIEGRFKDGQSVLPPPVERLHYMITAAVLVFHNRQNLVRNSLKPMRPMVGGGSGSRQSQEYMVRGGEDVFRVALVGSPDDHQWEVAIDAASYSVRTPEFEYYRRRIKLDIDGSSHMFRLQYRENHIRAFFCGIVRTLEIYSLREWSLQRYMVAVKTTVAENVLRSPMPGVVTDVRVRKGAGVHRGEELLRIESMKMESIIASPCDGAVANVLVHVGSAVETDKVLVEFTV